MMTTDNIIFLINLLLYLILNSRHHIQFCLLLIGKRKTLKTLGNIDHTMILTLLFSSLLATFLYLSNIIDNPNFVLFLSASVSITTTIVSILCMLYQSRQRGIQRWKVFRVSTPKEETQRNGNKNSPLLFHSIGFWILTVAFLAQNFSFL